MGVWKALQANSMANPSANSTAVVGKSSPGEFGGEGLYIAQRNIPLVFQLCLLSKDEFCCI
jgi:hypothetical protein